MQTETAKEAVCVILQHDGKFLGVSRKYDINDWGLMGGKVEADDPSPELAAIREAREETGLDIYNLRLVDTRHYGGYFQYCYTADYRGYVHYDEVKEPHAVVWVTAQHLFDGSFGDYNREVFSKLGLV